MRKRAVLVASLVFAALNLFILALALNFSRLPTMPLPTVAVLPSDTPRSPSETLTLAILASNTPSNTPTEISTMTALATTSPISRLSDTPTDTQVPTILSLLPTQDGTPIPVMIKIKESLGTQARSGPGVSYDVVKQVSFNTIYAVRAYSKDYFGHIWYLVDLPDNQTGWILEPAAKIVTGRADRVAVVSTVPATPTLTPTLTLTPANGLEEQLQLVPVYSGIGPVLRDIYFKGQRAGNHSNVLAKVGDCNSVADAFLSPLDNGVYRLGRFAFLQQAISRFKGSFARDSIAAQVGFNVITAQDSMWASRKYCGAAESPIDCEYRVGKPSVAIIMFGANDVTFLTAEVFRKNLGKIIVKTIDQGIIPVLMTFTWHDHGKLYPKVINFNLIIADLAKEYHMPLINFWLAAQYLPDHGIAVDNAHLSLSGNGLDFIGEQMRWGHTLRSFLVLDMLDQIQQELDK